MSDVAIRVEGLSKLYRLGKRERYRTLRDTLVDTLAAPFRRLRSGAASNGTAETIWALKDVSFDVKHGEVIGIIGRNGAGKSTLLKILSRITEPTEGSAEIHGRVGSLLEVGTGFHPELTGRENIFLNGAILGMKTAEIQRRFDEIVDFAEIEKFVDTPVKHFSSGMHMRLAFAVAAHLEPETLIIDEVLSVGDLAFQTKCLGKMGNVAQSGRTILFVSHHMNQIRRLCGHCIWLDGGSLRQTGKTVDVAGAYESAMACPQAQADRRHNGHLTRAKFLQWGIEEPSQDCSNTLEVIGPLAVCFVLEVNRPIRKAHHGIALFSNDGQLMWGTAADGLNLEPGVHELLYRFSTLPLRPGTYFWQVSLYDDTGAVDIWDCYPEFIVGTRPLGHSHDRWAGVLNIPYNLTVQTTCQAKGA